MFYRLAPWLMVLTFVTACKPLPVAPAGASAHRPVAAPPQEDARIYDIDAATSQVDILVYRGGPMARLGHNHVITSRSLEGRVWVHEQLSRSGFELRFPVNEAIVDDRAARLAAGAEFPPDIPEKDKAGTRANMLRAEVLDAERYSHIMLHSVSVAGSLPDLTLTTAITIRDVTRDVAVPAQIVINGSTVQASGEFTIRQTDFGIKPFSVAMGAVQVQDEVRIRFDLHARLTAP